MQRPFQTFVGVDLGGAKGKTTALARLEATPTGVRVVEASVRGPAGTPWYDDPLLGYLRALPAGTAVGIDAPLTLTACVRCQLPVCPGIPACVDPTVVWFRTVGDVLAAPPESERSVTAPTWKKPLTTPYTQRATEIILHREHGILPRETLGQGMGPLTARARHLTRALADRFVLGDNLLEVYPKATVHNLFGARAARRYKREVDTWQTRAELLEALSDELEFAVWREGCLQSDHIFDAVLCAYTTYLWARDGWQIPAQHQAIADADGWIWFPPVARNAAEAPQTEPDPGPDSDDVAEGDAAAAVPPHSSSSTFQYK